MNVPAEISDLVPAIFDNEESPLYAQAATATFDGAPNVRTVHFRYAAAADALCFACHVESPKWKELEANPRIASCYFHPKKQIQLRWNANATLLTNSKDPIVRASWDRTQEWIQSEYGDENLFGVVLLDIDLWDFYEIDLKNPSNSQRRVWVRNGDDWWEESRETLK